MPKTIVDRSNIIQCRLCQRYIDDSENLSPEQRCKGKVGFGCFGEDPEIIEVE